MLCFRSVRLLRVYCAARMGFCPFHFFIMVNKPICHFFHKAYQHNVPLVMPIWSFTSSTNLSGELPNELCSGSSVFGPRTLFFIPLITHRPCNAEFLIGWRVNLLLGRTVCLRQRRAEAAIYVPHILRLLYVQLADTIQPPPPRAQCILDAERLAQRIFGIQSENCHGCGFKRQVGVFVLEINFGKK